MNDKLTAKQLKELVGFHKKPYPGKARAIGRARIVTDPEEVAKIMPGIVSHYIVNVKRPSAKGSS